MKKKITRLAIFAIMLLGFYGCASLSGLTNFVKCNFDFNSVSDVTLCNINVSNKNSVKDFSVLDGVNLAKAFLTKDFPLSLNVHVDVKNPNSTTARLDGFDYILWIDNTKMTSGSMSKQVIVGANQTVMMPVNFSVNLQEILTSETKDKLISFGCGLATKNADASRVKLSLKPYFTIGTKVMKFPSYITIGGDKLMPSEY